MVAGRRVLHTYNAGVYENPQNMFQRASTFCTIAVIGIGPYLNKRFMKYSWIVRKTLMLSSIMILSLVYVMVYYIVKNILEMIFL
ncbi:hypothetical protein [Neobacillus niacini]|uniref:hypothetical protein n=1 Tax=Neobacillus niacini TaxID=86668 RepID=UPI00285FAE69|nr:hypothetical protein [Neobacillus niacini]MDR6999334.1 hypothetical protein [Neobacillus niacini]